MKLWNSDTREWLRRLRLPATDAQLRAMGYLEHHGQRFLVEFGIENAIENARSHWRERKRQQRAKKVAKRANNAG